MSRPEDLRCAPDDAAGLRAEIERRDRIIEALVYQAESNPSAPGQDYGLLQTTFMLEEQIRQRTEELVATLKALREMSAEASAARHQLEAAMDNMSDGFALFDADDRILLCNEAFRRLWGLNGNLGGRPFRELLAACATDPTLPHRVQACRSRRERSELKLPSGQILQIRERRMDDGGLVGIYSDVTDLKAEEALLRQQALARKSQLLQSTLDSIDQGIAVFGRDEHLVACNQRFFTLLTLPTQLAETGATLATMRRHSAAVARLCPPGLGPQTRASRFEQHADDGAELELGRFPMPDDGFVLTVSDVTSLKEGEARIGRLLVQQRAIFDNAHVGIIFCRDRLILDANQHMAEIFGYHSPADLIGQRTEILYANHADYLEVGGRIYRDLATRGYSEGDIHMVRKDGSPLWIRLSGRPLDARSGGQGSIWVFSDITRQREQHAQLELAQLVFNHSNEALMVTDADNRIESVNSAFTTITGYGAAEVLGKTPSVLKSGQHDAGFYKALWSALEQDDRWEGEIVDRHKSGRHYPKWLTIRVVRNPDGSVAHYVAAFSDISARKAAEAQIQYMAHHDALTGLPNRILLRDRFEQASQRSLRNNGTLGMFFLDLDQFKHINDTLGHAIGDDLLMAVTNRLAGCLRHSDTISRLGGDEFIILVEGDESTRFYAGVAEKICRALEKPFELGGHALTATGTLGVAVAPGDGQDFDTLLKKADMAMYHAKARGRATFSFFDERMNQDSAERLSLTTHLRRALGAGELRLVYQPQFAIGDSHMIGAEALMRWRSPQYGEISPARFIPLAEDTGLILPIGEWALHESCRQAREWTDRGQPIKIAVNVSAVQLHRDDFSATLAAVLRDTGVAPQLIELELTESALMSDAARFIELIAYVRNLGMSVAIDDFGTGYSSLAYLKRFQVSKLKVDRSFVKDIPDDEEDRAIAEAIVRMGQSLKLRVIAEGVETREQLDFLAGIGCHEVQGYLLGRPVEAAALSAGLTTGTTAGRHH
jgi:diguanylate cyclase (GGDEF)-like protein/PAS domain S-box-containing protein